MNNVLRFLNQVVLKCVRICKRNDGFGLNELLGICAAIILAAFIVIPGLRTFTAKVMTDMSNWWDNTVMTELFPNS